MAGKSLFALDIGSGTIRGAYALIDENHNIKVNCFAETNYAGFSDGELLEPENLQNNLAKVLTLLTENSQKKIKHLVVGIPSEFCGVIVKKIDRYFDKPTLISESLISSILKEELQNTSIEGNRLLHCDYISFYDNENKKIAPPYGKSEMYVSMDISIVYAVDSFCNYLENCLSNCDITDVEFVSAPLAQAQTLFTNSQREEGVVLMDNGFISSFIASIKGNGLTSLASFGLGGGHITALLMEGLNLGYSQADELKHKIILTVNPIELDFYESDKPNGFAPIPARQVNRYVKLKLQQVANITKKITNTINKDYITDPTLYITGNGVASLKGSKEILEENLELSTEFIGSSIMGLESYSLSSLASIIYWWFKHNWKNENIWTKFLNLFKKR